MDFSSHDPVCSGQLHNQSALHSLASRSERLVMVGSLYSGWWPTATPVPKQYSWKKSTFSSALFRSLEPFSCLYVRAHDNGALGPVAAQVTRSINDSCCTHRNVYLSSNANATAICALLRKRPGCANVRCLTFSDLDVNNTHGEMLARFTPATRGMLLDVFACSHASIECKPADYHSGTLLALIRAAREGQLSEASAATSRIRSKPSDAKQANPRFTIVSGANAGFASRSASTLQYLAGLFPRERFVWFDLGYTRCQHQYMREIVGALRATSVDAQLRLFNFTRYPEHVSSMLCYAFKPLALAEVAVAVPVGTRLVWLDSGQELFVSGANASWLDAVLTALEHSGGFISEQTPGSVTQWTFPAVFDYFYRTYGLEQSRVSEFRPCNGAFSAHIVGSASWNTVTEPWFQCATQRACICPAGSNRSNHRQDQSALTLLAVRAGYHCRRDRAFWTSHHGRDRMPPEPPMPRGC